VGFIADCVVATQADLLRLLRNNLKPKKDAVRHRETGENLSERILSEIRVNPGINTPALASMLNLSLRTTQRQLQALSESGKIEFRGARKNGGYFSYSE
jgi:predicted HTH transcriptional regulator